MIHLLGGQKAKKPMIRQYCKFVVLELINPEFESTVIEILCSQY